MPIPILQNPDSKDQITHRVDLRLADRIGAMQEEKTASFSARTLAHLVDLGIVQGFSLHAAKLCGFIFLSLQPGLDPAGAEFLWEFSAGLFVLGSFFSFSLVYFVALPLFTKRTLGMGLFGLKLKKTNEESELEMADLLSRFFWCLLYYASLGSLLFFQKNKKSLFLQDEKSGTFVSS